MKREFDKGDGTKTRFAYTANERFGPWDGESWRTYVKWSGLTQLGEVLFDGILCPRLVSLDCDEDWNHNLHEDFEIDLFWDEAYLRTKLTHLTNWNLLAVARNPATDPKDWAPEEGFQFVGSDLVEIGGGISALTNCGGFPDVFSNSEISSVGLIPEWHRAIEIQSKLATAHPREPHAQCDVWSIWRWQPPGR